MQTVTAGNQLQEVARIGTSHGGAIARKGDTIRGVNLPMRQKILGMTMYMTGGTELLSGSSRPMRNETPNLLRVGFRRRSSPKGRQPANLTASSCLLGGPAAAPPSVPPDTLRRAKMLTMMHQQACLRFEGLRQIRASREMSGSRHS